ncbi:hypothetical protein H6P81_004735 [Aristolochia fimbriata]|uniref:F-box domain-containing protein n=1 Tax=Aristolochia fimbriata TaxID=158543 RepID=A0AAV7EW24_ARIFI|nr:hypothetical protein H6P81_004735 [Aristolochia fimbriata]
MLEDEREGVEERSHEERKRTAALRPCADLMSRIFSQLDCVDLLHCSLVCKQWYRYSSELREGWKSEYIEAYIQLGLGIKREIHPPSSTCSIRA